MDYKTQYQMYLSQASAALEDACAKFLPEESEVCRAARYSLLGGGKRIRAVLVLAVCDMLNGDAAAADQFAAAVEMLHCYSLIHDDLPCMDNDDLRRGKPSCHKAFGEANAILAGDGLLSLAFCALSRCTHPDALSAIAKGAFEMVMGQSLDVNSGGDESLLRQLQDYKTGALFRAAVTSGAACAGAAPQQKEALVRFADAYGMLFQITDDILDCEGEASVLGKTVGKDAEEGKTTFVTVYGLERAKEYAKSYAHEAREAIASVGGDAAFFTELIRYTLTRKS